jgi:hypothetical protein
VKDFLLAVMLLPGGHPQPMLHHLLQALQALPALLAPPALPAPPVLLAQKALQDKLEVPGNPALLALRVLQVLQVQRANLVQLV